MADVYCSVLCFSLLCWMYIAVCFGCHGHVGCITQSAVVVFIVLNVYCFVLWLSLLCWLYNKVLLWPCWLYIVVYCGCLYCVLCILQCAINVKTISVVYCSAVRLP